MKNVYSLVEHFYEGKSALDTILPQDVVEKYLRRKAWHGVADEELKKIWTIISLVIIYVEQLNLYSLSSLTVNDYQELVYRYQQEDGEFCLDETSVMHLLAILEEFYAYLPRHGNFDDFTAFMAEVKASFRKGKQFFMPPRRSADEFYSSLEHREDVSDEELQHLNALMDGLLHRMDSFFRKPKYKMDLDRAVMMYVGPDVTDLGDNLSDEEARAFWLSFWDFFLFDYHLLSSDETPVHLFFQKEQENLSPSERDILLDLMQAKFSVFSIEYFDVDFVSCRNLLTDEILDLPMPILLDDKVDECLLYGHIHRKGVMMLNYVTVLPASKKLQKRMKSELMKQYELFKCQAPEASMEEFLGREAGAVRHALNILARFAQLKVVHANPVETIEEGGAADLAIPEHDREALHHFAIKFGMSQYSSKLALRLFEDYCAVSGCPYREMNPSILITAALLKFAEINGTDLSSLPEIVSFLGAAMDDVLNCMVDMREKLGCSLFDPRYLSEEGFIRSMYFD